MGFGPGVGPLPPPGQNGSCGKEEGVQPTGVWGRSWSGRKEPAPCPTPPFPLMTVSAISFLLPSCSGSGPYSPNPTSPGAATSCFLGWGCTTADCPGEALIQHKLRCGGQGVEGEGMMGHGVGGRGQATGGGGGRKWWGKHRQVRTRVRGVRGRGLAPCHLLCFPSHSSGGMHFR